MIQTARMPTMDASVGGSPRPDFADDPAGSGGMNAISLPGTCSPFWPYPGVASGASQPLTCLTAEGRVRKRLYRPLGDNGDGSRKQGLNLPFTTRATAAPPSSDHKPASHARRRSTLIQNKASLLGPRPLENSKRLDEIPSKIHSVLLTFAGSPVLLYPPAAIVLPTLLLPRAN
jgi:hypothetical protein